MADIDVGLITPSDPTANDFNIVRRGTVGSTIQLVPSVNQQVIDAKGQASSLKQKIVNISSTTSVLGMKQLPGYYYDVVSQTTGNYITGSFGGFDLLYLSPYLSSFEVTINLLSLNVSTASANNFARVAIYDAYDTSLRPKNLVFATGYDFDLSTTGAKDVIVSVNLEAGKLYYFGMQVQGLSTSFRSQARGAQGMIPTTIATSTTINSAFRIDASRVDPLPATIPENVTFNTWSVFPVIRYQVA